VSRHHCLLTVGNDGAWIRDLSSRNGTFVNGRRVAWERPLRDGDLIWVAASGFEVELRPGPRPAGNARGN
jgi:pSer/pThr/pTyr-binding forkhead associated (FHA) protein